MQFSEGADPRMKPTREDAHSGHQACQLDVPPGETLALIRQHGTTFVGKGDKPPLPLPGSPESVGLWVRGRNSGHRVWLQLLDAQGKAANVELGAVDFEGWCHMQGKVPALTAPIGLRGLLVRGGSSSTPLVVDDLTVTTAAEQPLWMDVRPVWPEEELVEGHAAQFRVVLQSLAAGAMEGRGEVVAFLAGTQEVSDRRRFSFRVSEAEPCAATVTLRLPAGVHELVVSAGQAECRQRVVVYPAGRREARVRPARAVRRFGERGDALRVYESALSPAIVVETDSDTLTLFRGLSAAGLSAPQDGLMRARWLTGKVPQSEMQEPWLLVWFGGSPKWDRVAVADGTPCPTFDVPFLLVFERRPSKVELSGDGLRVAFRGPAGRTALMPFYGIRRADPAQTTHWKEDVDRVSRLAERCRFWTRALRAWPVDAAEEWRVDSVRDEVEVRVRFSYLETSGDWRVRPLRLAPVPPLLTLARQAGLAVRFSREPSPTGCDTSVGPYVAVPDADGYSYTVSGLLRYVNRVVADVPPGGLETQVGLARNYWALASDAPKIPFWARDAGERGRLAAEALLRFMLWRDNARYEWDGANGRLLALDGLAWQEQGEDRARAAGAELLRGCWYGGFYAGLVDVLRPHWHQMAGFRDGLERGDDWATLGVAAGSPHLDARLNAELFFARLAARLGQGDAYAEASVRSAKFLLAAAALAAGAPAYVRDHAPWPGLADQGGAVFLSACRPGSVGFGPGPPPLVTSPSDAGYSFARDHLGEYLRLNFRSGPLDFYGHNPAEWAERKRVEIDVPRLGARFHAAPRVQGAFRGNYVFEVKPGPDGWPSLVWESHRAPAGGPLPFGSIGTASATRGDLRRTLVVSPYLRLSAYAAIEAPPPPTEKESPGPPVPEAPPAPRGGGTPDRSLP